jgi:NADH-quinone oxidoreductase subunit G
MTEQDLVTLTIEDTEVSVSKGTSILEAAKLAGITIPHYCYHPGLPIAGVCRMCLVEIEGVPNLQVSCASLAADGQKIHVYSEKAKKARQGVLEFLLVNHPLDCPICDQAGECELQNFVFEEARADSRYSPDYAKRFDPVEDFGGDIIYVQNRCIMCTRCVRFMEHLAGDRVISVQERGDRAFIGVHPDQLLDHPWAGNVVDLCPVGSLLSKDFLHKARAWELDQTASICPGCSQGCNIDIETLGETIVRLRPRWNPEVNRYFMCDVGRAEYKKMTPATRIDTPSMSDAGYQKPVTWDAALEKIATIVSGSGGRAVALVSPSASTEALFLLKETLSGLEFTGAFRVTGANGDVPLPGMENLALREERAPNATGARLLGYNDDFKAAIKAIDGASVLFILGETLESTPADALGGAANMIYVGSELPEAARTANVVLPSTIPAEEDGCYVNRDGRAQRYHAAKPPPREARPAWQALSELLTRLDRGETVRSAADAFAQMAGREQAFQGLSYEQLGQVGGFVREDQSTGGDE